MTPQDLVSALLRTNEEQGKHLLRTHVPAFSSVALDRLVYLIKKEADRCWTNDAPLSFVLAGYLLLVGDLTQNKYYHALGLMARGDALRRMDRDQEALPFFDAAGEEFFAAGDEVGWARTRIGRINACLSLNRTTEALRDASTAREIFMRHGKLLRAGQIDVNAAIVNYELGQYDAALRLFDRAIETYLLHGEKVDLLVARARGNKALTLAAMGKFREAVALHQLACATFALHGESQEIAVAREELNIADIFAAQGRYSQALQLYNRSRALFQKHDMDFAAAETAQQMCFCLMRLNRTREASELAAETAQFFRTVKGLGHNVARSLMHQATAATLEGKFGDAEAMLKEASSLLHGGGFVKLAALVHLRRAELYFADQQYKASLREAEHAADAFAEQEDLPHLAFATLLQAYLADAEGDVSTAQYLCDQALDIAQGQGLLDLKYRCDDLLGQLAEKRGDIHKAAYYYDRAVQGIDEVQSRLVMEERTSYLEDKGGIYQRAVTFALKGGNDDQALVYVEKAKSRVLGDYLRNNIDIRLRAGDKAGEAILEDLAKLREEQAWYSSIVYETENGANLSNTAVMRMRAIGPARARQEMKQRERHIERLLEQIQLRSAGDLVARPRRNWTTSIVAALWPKLPPRALMLEYYLAGPDLYIFQIARQGIDVQIVKGAVPNLERLMMLWGTNRDVTAQAAGSPEQVHMLANLQANSLGLLQRLYNLLIRPVDDLLAGCEHVIIVPYGMLHYLPFHCLFDGERFVVERLNVSYLPASALGDICRKRGQRTQVKAARLSDALVLGHADGGRLAFAEHEAEVVAQLLGTRCMLNKEATTALLWEAGPRSPLVHIAAHGLFRLDAPNFSHIRLADRQLSAIEVFNLDLSACSLLTLSACETGRAVIGGIDEVIGLGRGFFYAGAASLLPTLWKVDDASSAELMEMFYRELLSGASKAAALASAQRAFIARARNSAQAYRTHPYFWAAFQLIGDSGPLIKGEAH
ncbi:CHAT domain-containing protein [Ktedonosporobacter rubrisoli]|uniref:CHAT domain-containing protein n=1 Tax=Ktedonosporobacter rubrisoli TaxID=2509675 RepID=A0A4V0Z084_KTERU|nr:CHAT domain-containing tetratricopeptide repeat protein [Ktedonosporobacter rubrisoli]QBD82331.1 CHAT domain-containing protein [Ktedonosporobacter rubrisoli]